MRISADGFFFFAVALFSWQMVACSKMSGVNSGSRVVGERIFEVSAEHPFIDDGRDGRISVEGIPAQGSVTIKEVTSVRSDGKTVVSFESVAAPSVKSDFAH